MLTECVDFSLKFPILCLYQLAKTHCIDVTECFKNITLNFEKCFKSLTRNFTTSL